MSPIDAGASFSQLRPLPRGDQVTLPEGKGAALIGTGFVYSAEPVPEHTVVVGPLGERQAPLSEYVNQAGVLLDNCPFVLFQKLCYIGNVSFGEVDKTGRTGAAVAAFEAFELKPVGIKPL